MNQEHLQHLQTLVEPAETILVVFSPRKFDTVAAASSLYLGLQALGKRVMLLSPAPLEDDYSLLVGLDQIYHEIGNRNLHISFPYDPTSVNKVSYHIDENEQRFYLVVQPEKSGPPLDASQVEFKYAGAEADLVFLVGVNSFEELDQLYDGYQEFYQQTTTVAVNNFQPPIGTFKFDTAEIGSLSGLSFLLLKQFGVEVSSDLATNLLAGIEDSTDSFHSLTTTPFVFETAAELMRLGGRRIRRRSRQNSPQVSEFTTAGEVIAGKEIPLQASGSNNSFAQAMGKKAVSAEQPNQQHPDQKSKNKNKNTSKTNPVPPTNSQSPKKKPGGLDYQPPVGGVSGK